MKKIIFVTAILVSLLAAFTGCGANDARSTQSMEESSITYNEVVEARGLSYEATTEPNYVPGMGYTIDYMTDESWALLKSEENQKLLDYMRDKVVIVNIDGNYVLTQEQFNELYALADRANWGGTFEAVVLYGEEVDDKDTGCRWWTNARNCFWMFHNNTYVLTDVDLKDWYNEGGCYLEKSGITFALYSDVQTRFGKITLYIPKS